MRRAVGGSVVAAVVGAGLLAAVPPADAGTSPTQKVVTVSRPYAQNWVYRSSSLKACLFVEMSGTLRATHRYAYYAAGGDGWDTRTYLWYGAKLVNPTVKVTGWPISGAGCDSTRRVSFKKLSLGQNWYEGSCDLSAQVSVGVPWSISVTPTYSCGSHRVARRVSSADAPGSSLTQTNAGTPAYFKGQFLAPAGAHNPFRANLSVVAYRKFASGTVSDSWTTRGAVGYVY